MKELLKKIWLASARANPANNAACRFQTMLIDSVTETWVCSRAVLCDYAPSTRIEMGTLQPVDDLPLKQLPDPEVVLAENMFYRGTIPLEDYSLLGCAFLNEGPGPKENAISVFQQNGQTMYYKCNLPWGDETSFQWLRKIFNYIPTYVSELVKDAVTLQELGACLVRLKASPNLALLLQSSTAWLLVTMSVLNKTELANEQIFIDNVQYRLDGWDNETKAYSRLVEVTPKAMTMRGLANPTKAAQQAAPVEVPQPTPPQPTPEPQPEPQVEDVQPEQAQQIAAEAPQPTEAAPIPEQTPTEPPQEEEKKKRIRKAPTAATPANAKALEDTIAYLGSPVADTMAQEDIDEEIRKCRDLGVVLARRMANLYAAGTLIPKKKLAAVSAILN